MKHQFNIASLAKLTKSELQTLLATYQARLSATGADAASADLQSKISMIKSALTLK